MSQWELEKEQFRYCMYYMWGFNIEDCCATWRGVNVEGLTKEKCGYKDTTAFPSRLQNLFMY